MPDPARVAIVDFGLGNLYSVNQACLRTGLDPVITDDPAVVASVDGVILPGVGAFADAMRTLGERKLVDVIVDGALTGRPLLGICLGLQLLFTTGHEFGTHRGLGIIDGDVVRLQSESHGNRRLKIPQIGWSRIHPPDASAPDSWDGTPLSGLTPGTHMYFVHSYYVRPVDSGVVLAETTHGSISYCAAIHQGNVFGLQFHPERSGRDGLRVYRNFAKWLVDLRGGTA